MIIEVKIVGECQNYSEEKDGHAKKMLSQHYFLILYLKKYIFNLAWKSDMIDT